MGCNGFVDMKVAKHDDSEGNGEAEDVQAQNVRACRLIHSQVVKRAGGLKTLQTSQKHKNSNSAGII